MIGYHQVWVNNLGRIHKNDYSSLNLVHMGHWCSYWINHHMFYMKANTQDIWIGRGSNNIQTCNSSIRRQMYRPMHKRNNFDNFCRIRVSKSMIANQFWMDSDILSLTNQCNWISLNQSNYLVKHKNISYQQDYFYMSNSYIWMSTSNIEKDTMHIFGYHYQESNLQSITNNHNQLTNINYHSCPNHKYHKPRSTDNYPDSRLGCNVRRICMMKCFSHQ